MNYIKEELVAVIEEYESVKAMRDIVLLMYDAELDDLSNEADALFDLMEGE